MTITLPDFLASPELGGACEAFRDLTPWRSWLAFGRAAYGLDLEKADRALYRRSTGRSRYKPVKDGYREVVAVVARQAGKTRFAAAVVAFETFQVQPRRQQAVGADQRPQLRQQTDKCDDIDHREPAQQQEPRQPVTARRVPFRPGAMQQFRGLSQHVTHLEPLLEMTPL